MRERLARGEDVSARGIRDQIEKLVANEDPKNPLTDQAIVEILQQTGVQIARRTQAIGAAQPQPGPLPKRTRTYSPKSGYLFLSIHCALPLPWQKHNQPPILT